MQLFNQNFAGKTFITARNRYVKIKPTKNFLGKKIGPT